MGKRQVLLAVIATIAGCDDVSGGDPAGDAAPAELDATPAATSLVVELSRAEASGPDVVVVDIEVMRGDVGEPEIPVEVTALYAEISEVVDRGDGHYRAEVTPLEASGLIPIRVSALGMQVERTAVVLPEIDARWGQPELVPGLVNTPGYEDSAEVSPDGEWLIVSDASPLDLICCALGCGSDGAAPLDPAGAACNHTRGPFGPPERPDFPGADRILSPTVVHDELPRVGLDLPDGEDFEIAIPPAGGYGFRRQPDGSFGEPFSIAFVADGMHGLFGFTFVRPPEGTHATLMFSLDTLDSSPDSPGVDLYYDPITLGERHILGTYTPGPDGPVVDRYPTRVMLTTFAGKQGNPTVTADGVIHDSENEAEDLFFLAGDPFGQTPLAAPVKVALSRPDRRETMPFMQGNRLYFSDNNSALRSSLRAASGDPALAQTWGPERFELGAESDSLRVGAVLAVGEPSIEVRDGVETLYFVCGVKTSTGLDLGVARVRSRAD